MKRFVLAVAIVLSVASSASAHGHRVHRYHNFAEGLGRGLIHMLDTARPRAWCGWYMRELLGVSDRSYNLARNWVGYGRPAMGPHVGAIVVWPHHVGLITGGSPGAWVVKSGNDGHAVRERARSVAGAIAFREP
jgi:hypothetical protein